MDYAEREQLKDSEGGLKFKIIREDREFREFREVGPIRPISLI